MDTSKLHTAVDAKFTSSYMSSKQELVQHYQQTYLKGWKQQLVKDLAAQTGIKPKNLERRFDPSRLNAKTSAKNAAQYKALGEKFPPIKTLKNDQITVTIKGHQGVRERTWSTTFTGPDAYAFANNPNYRDFFKKLKYNDNVINSFEGGDSGEVDVYEVV